jgi:FMN-dependent oxidoreductase (nitrilotriacetate monooxygenase family)
MRATAPRVARRREIARNWADVQLRRRRMPRTTLALGAILSPTGSHVAGWRHPDCPADGAWNIRRYIEQAQAAEAAGLDFVFLADNLALKDAPLDDLSRTSNSIAMLEPMTALGAVSAMTERIGLVATMSTTYTEPYNCARMFASLDHISGGRAGWNLVTSAQPLEALNFSRGKQDAHDDRYARAGEFADVVRGLWDTWDDGALIADKAEGRYFRPEGVHRLDHEGERFQVRGPANMLRPPQGHPVTFQAGSSGPGMDLAARTADCVFTAQGTLEGAAKFRADLRARVAAFGRDPDAVAVMPGLVPFVAATEAEAKAKFEELQELVLPEVGLSILSAVVGGGVDLSIYPIDGPVPELPATEGNRTFQANLLEAARREGLTLRQLYLRYAAGFGHMRVIGSVEQVADHMEKGLREGAVDGFAISSPVLPGSLTDFLDLVVPELKRRGVLREDYTGVTLRDHLGLARA